MGNGLWEQMTFNTRLQVTQIGLGTSETDTTSKLLLVYGYGGTDNNGNVRTQTINIAATNTHPSLTLTQTYTYDALNRLATANEGSWAQNYGYDRYGNRRITSATGGVNNYNPSYNLSNNQIVGLGYDSAGNLTYDPTPNRTLTYDAENRLQTATNGGGSYSYDGEGRRVQKAVGSATTVFVYNAAGQLAAEYANSVAAAGSGGTKYVTADALGSTRVVTSGGKGEVKARYDYLPFGEELAAGLGGRTTTMGYSVADTTRQKFGAKERDTETGLDYFLARYYSNTQGRFTSPDEFQGGPKEVFLLGGESSTKQALPYAEIANPQSLNKYSYALNNPLRYVDPDGHMPDGGDGIIDRIIKSLTEVFGSLTGRLQRAVQGGNPNPENEKEQFIQDYTQAVGKGVDLTTKIVLTADVTGAGTVVHGYLTGNKSEMAAGAAATIGAARLRMAASAMLGVLGENALGRLIGGASAGFMTSQGARVVDRVVAGASGTFAHEAKVGFVVASKRIRNEISKDAELLATGQVKAVTWHFYQSPLTGGIGASQTVLDALKKNGITHVIHQGVNIAR